MHDRTDRLAVCKGSERRSDRGRTDYFLQEGEEARTQFAAATTGLKRIADVDAVVCEYGTPWFAKYGLS
jgi:hypothetical protein